MDEECLANDGRRSGTCYNVYECRQKGGIAKGECAMGFGVCCLFIASCDQDIVMNITYIVSPNFPSAMPKNLTSCKMKIKMMNSDISQLRLDFYHFSLGQPNRKTGVCDGDIFQMTGGLGGSLILCGHNSGQHVYYDVGGRITARQAMNSVVTNSMSEINNSFDKYTNMTASAVGISTTLSMVVSDNDLSSQTTDVEILMNFTNRVIPTRIWEIRILQIPFSQRAPAGCLQYFSGQEGIIQTFNFADNGRHLANQDYKACIRQEKEMCSVIYEPCDEQSFRIGPNNIANDEVVNEDFPDMETAETLDNNSTVSNLTTKTNSTTEMPTSLSDLEMTSSTLTPTTTTTVATTIATTTTTAESSSTPLTTTVQADNPVNEDEVEGSGEADEALPAVPTSTRSPIGGGFDVLSFLSKVFDFRRRRRSSQQFFKSCTDRITMPCIIEDFIGAGMGTLPGCEPVHCGDYFCSSGTNGNCKIETTVTPFYLGIHFGDGLGKGSPEENIGACLKYNQMPCL